MKYIFTIINMFLIATAAYFCVNMIYKNMIPGNFMLPEKYFPETESKDNNQQLGELSSDKNKYGVIIKRNFFKVEIEEKSSKKKQKDDKETEKLELTSLNLSLWGTVTGGAEVYAVIEDKKLRQQALYESGDSIQGATIKKILRHKVILAYKGKDQILEIETDDKNVSKSRMLSKKTNSNIAPNKFAFQEDISDDTDDLTKQIKIRPHFTEGEADGLMVYSINPNSIFREIGLRNGDIINDINGTQIVSAEDASTFYDKLKDGDDTKITLFRRGKIKELFYPVENDQNLITKLPENNERNKGEE